MELQCLMFTKMLMKTKARATRFWQVKNRTCSGATLTGSVVARGLTYNGEDEVARRDAVDDADFAEVRGEVEGVARARRGRQGDQALGRARAMAMAALLRDTRVGRLARQHAAGNSK